MIDVLNLEWDAALSRDRQMASLVCNYLRFQGVTVKEGSVFQGYELIRKYRPRILFFSNITGAKINYNVAVYAVRCGIKVVSLVSEGNFRESELDQFLWGWNEEKVLLETVNMQWTERTRKMTLEHYPKLQNKIKVSGGVGFDVYKLLPLSDKKTFLKKYGKDIYEKIIGVGCWDFGIFFPDDTRFSYEKNIYSEEEIAYFRKDGELFNKILRKVVLANPDILFLLKEHPGVQLGRKASGIIGLESFPNVLILKQEEPIITCLSVSDFWITYESTTALEGWLLDKKTCLLNPQGGQFKRDKVAKGSPIFSTFSELQQNIRKFYLGMPLDGYIEKETVRNELIKETIQWSDGFNHVRAGNEIKKILEKEEGDKVFINVFRDTVFLRYFVIWRLCLLPFIGKRWSFYLEMRRRFSKKQIEETNSILQKYQLAFYQKNNMDQEKLKTYECL